MLNYFETIRLILSLKLKPAVKIVLVYLFDKQGENRDSWPSIDTISMGCFLGRSTVIRSLEKLYKLRLVKVKKAAHPSAISTNHYTVDIEFLTSVKMTPVSKRHQLKEVNNQCQNDTATSVKMTPEPVSKRHPNDSLNDSINDSIEKTTKISGADGTSEATSQLLKAVEKIQKKGNL